MPDASRRSPRRTTVLRDLGGAVDRMRDELFGPGLSAQAMGSLLDPDWFLATWGAAQADDDGAGQRGVIAVDGSGEMLQAAKRRLPGLQNVELRKGGLESLPIDDESLDAAVVALVLHHVPDPHGS